MISYHTDKVLSHAKQYYRYCLGDTHTGSKMAKTRQGMFNPQFKVVGVAREGEGQVGWGAL